MSHDAPFFNRDDVLLAMLQGHYFNSINRGTLKPKYAIQMLGPGSGKTRILTEWVMQAFANQTVIEAFLYENGHSNHQDVLARKKFLNTLYLSTFKQHTILSYGTSWRAASTSPDALKQGFFLP